MSTDVKGIVVFVHGSGSSRHSPRNKYVANVLQEAGFLTLLFDLLTAEEEAIDNKTAEFRFNIPLLTRRVIQTIEWLKKSNETKNLKMGLFGASTGAAAALAAAAEKPEDIQAVVSRGGRPDLAKEALPKVKAPTLLIVGENDPEVIKLNQMAKDQMVAETELVIIPGATHLFEEEGALEEVAKYAASWFTKYLS